jgi:hypothetical protein
MGVVVAAFMGLWALPVDAAYTRIDTGLQAIESAYAQATAPSAAEVPADAWLVESVIPLGFTDDGQHIELVSFLVPLSGMADLAPVTTRAGPYVPQKPHTRVFCIVQSPLGLEAALQLNPESNLIYFPPQLRVVQGSQAAHSVAARVGAPSGGRMLVPNLPGSPTHMVGARITPRLGPGERFGIEDTIVRDPDMRRLPGLTGEEVFYLRRHHVSESEIHDLRVSLQQAALMRPRTKAEADLWYRSGHIGSHTYQMGIEYLDGLAAANSKLEASAAKSAGQGPVIIGETMSRVEAAATKYPGAKILNDMPDFKAMGMNADQVTSSMMQYNRKWMLEQMRSGRQIIDIGAHANRANPSIFYQMEQNMLRNYQKLHPEFSGAVSP